MDRRRFIKLSALTGTSATLASCGNPEYHLIRFVPEDRLVPGIAVWKPSVCPLCPAGCGVTVRVMEGDAEVIRQGQLGVTKMGLAKKLEGNPAHPINQGKLCTRGQAAIQVTYHPDRIGHPLKRSGARGEGQFEEISWEQGLSELISKLDSLAASSNQKSLAILTNHRPGLRSELIARFANQFGAASPMTFEFFDNEVVRRANALSFGRHQLPTLDLGNSKYVISFGSDFLGTWNSPVAQNVAYGQMRQGRPGVRGKFVQVEYRMSQTGANADEWIAIKPGSEGILALGLAHVIMQSGLRKPAAAARAGSLIDGWTDGLMAFTPSEVEKKTGVSALRIERLAKEFASQQPGLAIAGGPALAQTNGLFNALAVNALNALVESVGVAGGISFMPGRETPPTPTNFAEKGVIGIDSRTQLLLIDGSNPVFATPKAWKVRDAMMQVPFIVSFGNFIDETSVLADLILPDDSFLESWVHAAPESGAKLSVSGVAGPVMRPLHDTRSVPDIFLEVGRRLQKPLNLPWQNFEDMLKESLGQHWDAAQKQGVWSEETSPAPERQKDAAGASRKFTEPQFDGETNEYAFHFLPYPSVAFLDGSLAHLPLMQELPDPMSSAMWSSWVEINLQTAEKLNVRQGDILEITSTQGTIRAPAFPSPAIAPDVIAMPVGQGHDNYTRYATGRGENPISILAPVTEQETGTLAWAATRVKVAKIQDADGRLVLFAGSLREYPGEKVHR
jgi:anaerobic selenocysteine-containing dehydrogenase